MQYTYSDFQKEVIGSGMSLNNMFKTNMRTNKGETNVIYGEDKINDSIYSILSTRIGERVFLPEYGSRLYQCIFEQNTLINRDLMELYTKEALRNWEKRIEVIKVEIGSNGDSNTVPIMIYYRIIKSNIQGSYVYPFNLNNDGNIDSYELGMGSINSGSNSSIGGSITSNSLYS